MGSSIGKTQYKANLQIRQAASFSLILLTGLSSESFAGLHWGIKMGIDRGYYKEYYYESPYAVAESRPLLDGAPTGGLFAVIHWRGPVYIQPEMLLTTCGYTYEYPAYVFAGTVLLKDKNQYRQSLTYLLFPIFIKVSPFRGMVRPFVQFGPAVGMLANASETKVIQSYLPTLPPSWSKKSNSAIFPPWNYGLMGGLGLDFGRGKGSFSLDLSLHSGRTNKFSVTQGGRELYWKYGSDVIVGLRLGRQNN